MVVLNCVGSFENPWKDPTEEAKAIAAWDWGAGTDTFRSVLGGDTNKVESFSQFLGLIQKQHAGSIARINLISHGNPGLISFTGGITKPLGKASHRIMLDDKTAITVKVLMDTEPTVQGNRETQTLGGMAIALRNRFAKGAEIFLYLCNSGADLEVIQTLANSLQVTVNGFSSEIWFRPECTKLGKTVRIDRRWMSRQKESRPMAGFEHLKPDVSRTPRPDPPAR